MVFSSSAITFAPALAEKGRTIGAPALLYGILLGFDYALPKHPGDDFKVECVRSGRDSDFDIERLVMLFNTELANDLGCGDTPVVIELQGTEGWDYSVAPDGSVSMLDRATGRRLRDVGMATVDSSGMVIPSDYVIQDGRIQIRIDASSATWPLTVE